MTQADGHYTTISIHAPRVGSDGIIPVNPMGVVNFNPRPPCGERRLLVLLQRPCQPISIHAPRVGSDCKRPKPLAQVSFVLHKVLAAGRLV